MDVKSIDDATVHECLKGFSGRMKNFVPFVYLVKKLSNLQRYPEYDMVSIGFSTMLFILENMLIGREECGIEEIAAFLQDVIYHSYDMHITQDEAREMAFYIRDSIAGSGGEVFECSYKDLENGEDESVAVKLIETSYYEVKKSARYRLTDQGMELLFKTREIYSEFRINITQMYLKQQIEKGVFAGALQTVNELNLQVRQLRERLESLVLSIRQNVLGVDFEDLKRMFGRIHEQFETERREFASIKRILKVQRMNIEKIDYQNLTEKELRALSHIQSLSERLDLTSSEHDRLFREKLDIIGEYVRMLEFRLRQGISEFIDFEKSIFDKIIAGNLPVDAISRILSPLFTNTSKHKVFNIMKAMEPQRVRGENEDEKESINIDEVMEKREKEIKEEAEKRNSKIEYYLIKIFEELHENDETRLSAVLRRFDTDAREKAGGDFDFFSLVVMLHQNGEIDLTDILEMAGRLVTDQAYNINLAFLIGRIFEKYEEYRNIKRITIISGDENIIFNNGNIITDFIIRS